MKHGMKFVALSILALVMTGCATAPLKGKIGDGKLEPVTKGAAKAALTAGAVAAPEYAAVLKRIQAQIENYGEKSAQTDQLAGYAFTRTYFYDGSPVPDPSRITWVDKWEKTESAGKATPPTATTNSAAADEADDALAAAIAALLEGE
jgi:hypothetical protein